MIKSPPSPTKDLHDWAQRVYTYLVRQSHPTVLDAKPVFLQHRTPRDKAIEDGLVMYDPQLGEPVYSKNGQWYRFNGVAV